jgi:hypothetical protein
MPYIISRPSAKPGASFLFSLQKPVQTSISNAQILHAGFDRHVGKVPKHVSRLKKMLRAIDIKVRPNTALSGAIMQER